MSDHEISWTEFNHDSTTPLPSDPKYTLIKSDGTRMRLDPAKVKHVYRNGKLVGYEYSGEVEPI